MIQFHIKWHQPIPFSYGFLFPSFCCLFVCFCASRPLPCFESRCKEGQPAGRSEEQSSRRRAAAAVPSPSTRTDPTKTKTTSHCTFIRCCQIHAHSPRTRPPSVGPTERPSIFPFSPPLAATPPCRPAPRPTPTGPGRTTTTTSTSPSTRFEQHSTERRQQRREGAGLPRRPDRLRRPDFGRLRPLVRLHCSRPWVRAARPSRPQ